MQEYDSKAFKTYLTKIKAHPYTSQAEYLDSQADYVVILYKARHKRWNATDVSKIRANIRNMLQHEHDTFKKYVEKIDKEIDEETVTRDNLS